MSVKALNAVLGNLTQMMVHAYQFGGKETESCPANFADGLTGPFEIIVAAFLPNGKGADQVPWPLFVGWDVKMDGRPHTET